VAAEPSVREARNILSHLERSVRARRTYGATNRMTGMIAERLAGVLRTWHESSGPFAISIRQGDFYLGETPVNEDETAADPLAEALFRDGVQGFVMGPEMGEEALARWIEILAQASRATADEDVVTLLWDEDIPGLDVDTYEGVGEAGSVTVGLTPQQLAEELRTSGVTGDALRGSRPPALAPEGPLVEPLAEVRSETRVDLTTRALEVIAELLVYHPTHLSADQAALLAGAPLAAYLTDGALAPARHWVGYLRALCDPARFPDFPHRGPAAAALEQMHSADRVDAFLSKVEGGPEADLQGVFDVLAGCGVEAIKRIEALQRRVRARPRREALGDLLVGLCRQHPEWLVERFRNARDPEVPLAVYGLFRHDPEFAAKEGQGRLRPGDRGAPAVIAALVDWPQAYTEAVREKVARLAETVEPTRVSACKLWLEMDDHAPAPLLIGWAKEKWFRNLSPTDQEVILRALVALGGPKATSIAENLIEGRSLLRSRTSEPTRIAAIRALGESDDPEVFKLLQRLQQGRSMTLVGACRQAMAQANRRAERRTTTVRTVTGRQPTSESPLATITGEDVEEVVEEQAEDADEAQEELERRQRQSIAAQLVVQLSAAMRSMRLYDKDNEAVDRMVEALVQTLGQLHGRVEGDLSLMSVDGIFFLGRERIRLPQQQIGVANQLADAFAERSLGGMAFLDVADSAACRGLCAALGSDVSGSDEQRLEGYHLALREHGASGIRLLPPLEVRTEAETAPDRAVRLAQAFLAAVRETESARASEKVTGLARLRRCAQGLVDGCLADPDGARHLVGLLVPSAPAAGHAVRVAACALWLAARAGLPRPTLADLTLAALTRDTGQRYLPEPERETDLDVHPLLGARDLLPPSFAQGRTQADISALRRLLVAFEHHLGSDGSGHPPLHAKRRVHPFAVLARAAEDFDDLLRGHGVAQHSPMEALLALHRNPPNTYSPGMVDALKALVSGVSKPGDRPSPIRAVEVAT